MHTKIVHPLSLCEVSVICSLIVSKVLREGIGAIEAKATCEPM